MRALLAIPCFLAALCLLSIPAAAKEPTPTEALLESIDAAERADDVAAWTKALETIPGVYAGADKKEQPKLMRALGDALRADRLTIAKTALEMMVKIDDGDAAWKHGLKRVFPEAKAEVGDPLDLDVLRTIYVLQPDGAIDSLLHLMKKARDPVLAGWSLRVLGTYGDSKRRVEVLEDLVKIIIANAPGKGRKGSSGSERFKAMATQIEATLNDLTGRDYTIKEWGPVWKEYKKRPELLFANPLPEDR